MQAEVGNKITVKGNGQGGQDRHGEIIEVLGGNGLPPYRVRWLDDYESLFFPSSNTVSVLIRHLTPTRVSNV